MQYDFIFKRLNENKYQMLNGIKVTEVSEGSAKGEVLLNENHLNPIGLVFGGVIFALMDTISTATALTRGYSSTTLDANIHFINQTHETKKIKGQAKTIKNGKKVLIHDIEVFDDQERLVSKATFTHFKFDTLLNTKN